MSSKLPRCHHCGESIDFKDAEAYRWPPEPTRIGIKCPFCGSKNYFSTRMLIEMEVFGGDFDEKNDRSEP